MSPEELKRSIRGLIVTPVTPFKSNFELDEVAWRELVRRLIDSGVRKGDGVIVPGSATGEFDVMTLEERKRIVKIAVDEADGEVPIVAAANATDPKVTIKIAEYGEEVGADGIMMGPPYYEKPGPEEVIKFYETVAEATDLGIIVYNNGYATQFDMPTSLLSELVSKVDKIVGLKELGGLSGMVWPKIEASINALKDRISVFQGPGIFFEPQACMVGDVGFCEWTIVNFAPQLPVSLWRAIKEKDWGRAQEIHDNLMPLLWFLMKDRHYARFKEAMNLLGFKGGVVRPPRGPIPSEEREELRKLLAKYDLLK
jgi:4-hydroxy-tetrahydrodipicolinate synthase